LFSQAGFQQLQLLHSVHERIRDCPFKIIQRLDSVKSSHGKAEFPIVVTDGDRFLGIFSNY
jgi:hypothetical protein